MDDRRGNEPLWPYVLLLLVAVWFVGVVPYLLWVR